MPERFFNLISQIRNKTYWQLEKDEVKSLNNTCPKILPQQLIKHSGLIGCVLSLLGMIVKRIKLEQKDSNEELLIEDKLVVKDEEKKELTGGRSG